MKPLFDIHKPIPRISITAGGKPCGIMSNRVVDPVFGSVSPEIKIVIAHGPTQADEFRAKEVAGWIESFRVPITKPKASSIKGTKRMTGKDKVGDKNPEYDDGASIIRRYTVELARKSDAAGKKSVVDGITDICGRPLCPYCFKFDFVVCSWDARFYGKRKYKEDYCGGKSGDKGGCDGVIATMPRKKAWEPAIEEAVGRWNKFQVYAWRVNCENFLISVIAPDDLAESLAELGIIRYGQLVKAANTPGNVRDKFIVMPIYEEAVSFIDRFSKGLALPAI